MAAPVSLGISLMACVVLVADFVYGRSVALVVAVPLGIWCGVVRRLQL